MKAIVISNCATKAYYQCLSAFFPEWEVRSVILTQAEEWIASGHEGFLEYLAQADVFFGLPNLYANMIKPVLNPQAQLVLIPSFAYMGNRLDCFWLNKVTSPTRAGVLNSRLAVKAYLDGKTIAQTLPLFCDAQFEAEGYYDTQDRQRTALFSLYTAQGIDLTDAFESWHSEGDFLYTPNHPETKVFYDILSAALRTAGLNTALSAQEQAQLRATSENYLADNIIWPIYPEIAARRGIKNPKIQWHAASSSNEPAFGLEEMLNRSFARFDVTPNLQHLVKVSLAADINRI